MPNVVLVEFPSDTGSVFVEIEEDAVGPLPASNAGTNVLRAGQSFTDAVSGIEPISRAVMKQIEGLAPDEATVQFGIKLTGKAGVVLASTEAEGQFTLTLTWKKPS